MRQMVNKTRAPATAKPRLGSSSPLPPHLEAGGLIPDRLSNAGRNADMDGLLIFGFYLRYHDWRKNVSGIVRGPLPFFWRVSKAG
jgi:hypothetical protein